MLEQVRMLDPFSTSVPIVLKQSSDDMVARAVLG